MSSQSISFADLSDEQLVAEVKRLAGSERRATAVLIRALMELDTRRFPMILDGLEAGSLTLTTVRLLAPHLTVENHERVLASARNKRKQDIEQIVASLNPKPAVPTVIRRLPVPQQRAAQAGALGLAPPTAEQLPAAEESAPLPPRPIVAPLAPERFKVQLTISRETREKLDRVQVLARHAIPNGDLTTIFDRALTLLLNELERRTCAATSSPRRPREAAEGSRHISAAVKREVWRRDGGRCAFIGRDGRCSERSFLEYHHVLPYAAGGGATTANIELQCRAHNAHEAALFFGSESPL